MSNKAEFKLADIQHAHFIGIGGIGMSGLARLFLHEKKSVSGSDRQVSDITQSLQKEGVVFFDTQVGSNLTKDIDLVVYTEAMSHDHEEMVEARTLGIPMLSYFDALGMVANEYYLIAVAGTHGKTTTTAMLIDIFEEAGLDPTAIVGSLRTKTKSNFRAGKSKYFIVEACEYRRDFLSLRPDVLVITNIEHDHVDYYKTLTDVQNAFHELALQVREGGIVLVDFSGDNIAPILEGLTVSLGDYGKHVDPTLKLKLPGMHNQLNAGAASAVASYVGVHQETTRKALEAFSSTWRRFEYKGKMKTGAIVIDDYSHHPTEIRAAYSGAREKYPNKKITIVHKPHTYSRTHEFFGGFVDELKKFDHVVLLPIYPAREENTYGISSEQLSNAIGEKSICFDDFDSVVTHLVRNTSDEDIVMIVGAGDVTEIATMLIT